MMLNVRPRFEGPGAPWPGIIMNAFDVKTLAGVGRTNGGRRWNALRGFKARRNGLRAVDVSQGGTVSNPASVAAAEQVLRDMGYQNADCYEEVLFFPGSPVYNRVCSPDGGSGYLGADIITNMSQASEFHRNLVEDIVRADIANVGPNYCSGWDCEDWQTPEGQAVIQQQEQHLQQTAPGYSQYTQTYGTPQQQAQQREAERVAEEQRRQAEAARQAEQQRLADQQKQATQQQQQSAADRQPGTVDTDEAKTGGATTLVPGMDTTTLLIAGVAAVALLMAMRK